MRAHRAVRSNDLAIPCWPESAARESTGQLIVDLDGVPIIATIIRSARRRRTIAIGVNGGLVTVRAPVASTNEQLAGLLSKRAKWLSRRLTAPAEPQPPVVGDGEMVPFRGRLLRLDVGVRPVDRPCVRLDGASLLVDIPEQRMVGGDSGAARGALTTWYRAQASAILPEIVRQKSAMFGLTPPRVLVRDQRRRWGSCAPDGTIRLNWRLVLVDAALAEYVVAHELAHLRHRHHQPAFWEEVARYIPDYLERRRELVRAGRHLGQW